MNSATLLFLPSNELHVVFANDERL